jgi:hypothetical protein
VTIDTQTIRALTTAAAKHVHEEHLMEIMQLDGIEQITGEGYYLVGRKFFVACVVYRPAFVCAIALNREYQILGKAEKQGMLWSWHPAQGDGVGGVTFPDLRADLSKVDGHLLPPIDKPQWPHDIVVMSSMMVTDSERAAIMASRGKPAPVSIIPTPAKAAAVAPQIEYAFGSNHHTEDWRDDGVAAYVADHELAKGTVIYRGKIRRNKASSYVPDSDDIWQHMNERAADESEFADNFPEIDADQMKELDKLMEPVGAWFDRHCSVGFYEVHEIQPYTVTAEDVAAAAAYREQRDQLAEVQS